MIKRRKYPERFADLFSRRDLLKRAVEVSKKRGVKFGIVEHTGPGYRIVNDEALKRYIDMLENYPVYKGLQPVYPNWSKAFSRE